MGQLIQSLDDKIQASVQAAMESHLRSVEAAPQPLSTPQQGNMTNTDYSDNLATLQASSASTSRLSGTLGFVSAAIGLPSLVPEKVKAKIWAGEYIDLQTLLPSKSQDSFRLEITGGEGTPTLQIMPNQQQAKLTLAIWIKAWNRFVAVLSLHKPHLTAGLAQHMETVMSLAEKQAGWESYDENFRQMVARGDAKWGSTHLELYMKAVLDHRIVYQQQQQQPHTEQNARNPRGTCYTYHNKGHCMAGADCKFQHKCYWCLGAHPASRCRAPQSDRPKVIPRFQNGQPVTTISPATASGSGMGRNNN